MIPIKDSQRSYSTPFVTIAFIAVNFAVFLYQITLDPFSANDFVFAYGFVPDRLNLTGLVTSMFLHGGWFHLLGNMLFLWVFGDNIEDILGHGRFFVFYIACGIAAALAQYALNPFSRVPMVGASGAIAGVMGAYMVKFPTSRIVTVVWFVFLFSFELPAWLLLIYWFILQFFSGIGSIADAHMQRGGTAFFAHVGGFVAGMILIFYFRTRDRYRTRPDLLW
jgi:membrane associated rhomboid family serine protease